MLALDVMKCGSFDRVVRCADVFLNAIVMRKK